MTLVAETFLQRTGARQAERVFNDFRVTFPTPADLVNAGPSAVRALTDKLGLHWRGPLLFSAATHIAARGGLPPGEEDALRALPGVGPYAAAAWLSLHRGKRAVIVDNNVARWLCRMEGKDYTAETRRKRWVAELADRLTPKRAFRAYNYAVLDFTMRVCRPRAPLCHLCPLIRDCAFAQAAKRTEVLDGCSGQ